MALEHEIAQFGRRMGIADLAFSPEGMMALEVEGIGRVCFERGPESVLVYLARPAPPYDSDMPRRILAACHYGKAHPIPLSGGMHKGQAILLTRMPERNATAASLENAVNYLTRQMNGIF
ncbi:MAG: type III secretion chaperone SycN [Desulfovibrio sp.]|jgi:type III secretion system chaperone SycN|nr:type III secretion chaperone SycN [Desulfovibrio sp.]